MMKTLSRVQLKKVMGGLLMPPAGCFCTANPYPLQVGTVNCGTCSSYCLHSVMVCGQGTCPSSCVDLS